MERVMRLISTAFLLLLLLVATGMGPEMMSEAGTCDSQSQRFKGLCLRKSNCSAVCQTEGFREGHCRRFPRRCFCTKHCA